MDSNLLQCDTLVAVLLLVIAGYRPFIGLLATIRKIRCLLHHTFEAVFSSNMNSEVIGTIDARVACSFVFTRPFSN